MYRVVIAKIQPVPAADWARAQVEDHLERVARLSGGRLCGQQFVDVQLGAVEVPGANEEALSKC